MKYIVDISPEAAQELNEYLDRALREFGTVTANDLLDAYDSAIDILEKTPYAATGQLLYIPSKYHFIHLWKHYWMVYQIYEDRHQVKIEYVIDNRMNYGSFVR